VRAKGVLRKRESRADCVKRKPRPEVAIVLRSLWEVGYAESGKRGEGGCWEKDGVTMGSGTDSAAA
jgi:hypothetical protein